MTSVSFPKMVSRRIQREFDSLIKDLPEGVTHIKMVHDDEVVWKMVVASPKESVYEGAPFVVSVKFGTNYPYTAPNVSFETKIFHPNVTFKGEICKEALGLDSWSMTSTVRMFIPVLRNFLSEPDVSNPLNPDAAIEYAKGMDTYRATVKRWLQTYNTSH